eukprot:228485-Prorocentrum_minimum.AAC.2
MRVRFDPYQAAAAAATMTTLVTLERSSRPRAVRRGGLGGAGRGEAAAAAAGARGTRAGADLLLQGFRKVRVGWGLISRVSPPRRAARRTATRSRHVRTTKLRSDRGGRTRA